MTYEFLPGPEPGQPVVTLPPGFTDRVMVRVEQHLRQRRRRRTIATVLTALCLAGGVFLLSARRLDHGRTPGLPETQAGPVTPLVRPAQQPAPQPSPQRNAVKQVVTPAPAPQPAPQQNAVKQARTAAPPAAHDHPVANASAGAHPEEVSLTLDGKAYRCPADILQPRGSNVHHASQVYDGKPGQIPAGILSHCRPDPTPRE